MQKSGICPGSEYVETVEKWAFHGCSMLKTVEFSGDPEVLGEWIINKGTKILCRKIPESMTIVGSMDLR